MLARERELAIQITEYEILVAGHVIAAGGTHCIHAGT
jgi:hypothetical protein